MNLSSLKLISCHSFPIQIAIHQIMVLQALAKCMGWIVLSSNTHLGVGTCEMIGNAAGCLLTSPNGKR